MLNIAMEPMVCLIPLLIVFNGFFGGVRHLGLLGSARTCHCVAKPA